MSEFLVYALLVVAAVLTFLIFDLSYRRLEEVGDSRRRYVLKTYKVCIIIAVIVAILAAFGIMAYASPNPTPLKMWFLSIFGLVVAGCYAAYLVKVLKGNNDNN